MPGLDGWSTAAKAQVAGSVVRGVILLRIESLPILRVWSGIGDFAIPADLIETAPATFQGMGELAGLPAVSQLINGQAERADFTVSGVTAETLALATEEAGVVKGAPVNLGYCVLDEAWQILSPVAWLWEGTADVVKTDRPAVADGVPVRSVTISVGSVFTGRRRPRLGFWTDAQQRRRSAYDAFCSYVGSLSRGATKRFKPRS